MQTGRVVEAPGFTRPLLLVIAATVVGFAFVRLLQQIRAAGLPVPS